MLIQTLNNEKEFLESELKKAKTELKKLPRGRLECHVRKESNGNVQYYWYVVKTNNRKYLPRKNIELAKKLAYKRKLSNLIGNYENQLIAINIYSDILAGKESHYLSDQTRSLIRKHLDSRHNKSNPEIDRLAGLYSKKKDATLEAWVNADYFNWDNHPESLTVKSKTGRIVRSRIEAAIDESLAAHDLYYRYEDPTILNNKCIYPDFTIIHPVTGEKIIWEHLGRLDLESYQEDNTDKFWRYISNGYYPNLNLIYTSEAHDATLDLQLIEELISLFLT